MTTMMVRNIVVIIIEEVDHGHGFIDLDDEEAVECYERVKELERSMLRAAASAAPAPPPARSLAQMAEARQAGGSEPRSDNGPHQTQANALARILQVGTRSNFI